MTYLMECTLVPILLQELLLALWLRCTSLLRTFQVLLESLLFWERPPSLDLLSLEFTSDLFLLVPLYASKLSQSPCFEFALRIEAVRVVYVRDLRFLFL